MSKTLIQEVQEFEKFMEAGENEQAPGNEKEQAPVKPTKKRNKKDSSTALTASVRRSGARKATKRDVSDSHRDHGLTDVAALGRFERAVARFVRKTAPIAANGSTPVAEVALTIVSQVCADVAACAQRFRTSKVHGKTVLLDSANVEDASRIHLNNPLI